MKNYSPETLKEVVQELDKIDKNMANSIDNVFCQNDYENGRGEFMHSALCQGSAGPLDFFNWDYSRDFLVEQFDRRNKQLNKIFKKKAKSAKKLKNDPALELHYIGHGIVYFRKPKVKNAVALMQALVDKGYKANEYGNWNAPGRIQSFASQMWQYAGTEDLGDLGDFNWEPEWLE